MESFHVVRGRESIPAVLNGARFEAGERSILGHLGPVQAMLASIFGAPVLVNIVDQRRIGTPNKRQAVRGGVHLVRSADLIADGRVVCHAVSRIPLWPRNRTDFLSDVDARKLGLGEIIAKYQIPSRRWLHAVGKNEEEFWRSYRVEGPNLELEISESFDRLPFVEIGWLRQESCSSPCIVRGASEANI